MMSRRKVLLPIVVVALGFLVTVVLVKARRSPVRRTAESPPPLVRVIEVARTDVRLDVDTQGTVAPETESVLVAEVSGKVVDVSPSLAPGGFFRPGDVLVVIEPRDFELAVVQAQAQVRQAEVRLALEKEEARLARQDWESLGEGEPSPLVLREPQLHEADAALASARAALDKALLHLERTRVRAPYAGRVRAKSVDVGQYVGPGTPLARVYSIAAAEVRLPLPLDQLEFLELPLAARGEAAAKAGPAVTLRSEFAGGLHEWTGRIVRTESEIDPQTRMLHAVARIEDPYASGADPERAPLAVGLFVRARIAGRLVRGVVLLPRAALRSESRVFVVDEEDRLRFRDVEVLRTDGETVVIERGLEDGELVCLSPLEIPVDGMKIRLERPSPEAPGGEGAQAVSAGGAE